MDLSNDQMIEVLHYLLLNRRFEEKQLEVYNDSEILESPHLSIGQDAVGVGACYPLDKSDILVPSHRSRAVFLMRMPVKEITAGIQAKNSSPVKGRTSHHHMGSSEHNILGTTGLIASHLNPATGAALGTKKLGRNNAVLTFVGDGAAQRGEFHTALNMSVVNDLPIIFILVNNHWSEMAPTENFIEVDDLVDLAGHGLITDIVDGQDVEKVISRTEQAVENAKNGDGPTLLEVKTYRYRPHAEHVRDHIEGEHEAEHFLQNKKEELKKWKHRDPVRIFREKVIKRDVMSEKEIEEMDKKIQKKVIEAWEFAETDSQPPEDAFLHVYKDTNINYSTGVIK